MRGRWGPLPSSMAVNQTLLLTPQYWRFQFAMEAKPVQRCSKVDPNLRTPYRSEAISRDFSLYPADPDQCALCRCRLGLHVDASFSRRCGTFDGPVICREAGACAVGVGGVDTRGPMASDMFHGVCVTERGKLMRRNVATRKRTIARSTHVRRVQVHGDGRVFPGYSGMCKIM